MAFKRSAVRSRLPPPKSKRGANGIPFFIFEMPREFVFYFWMHKTLHFFIYFSLKGQKEHPKLSVHIRLNVTTSYVF